MVIFSGLGFSVPLFAFLIYALCSLITDNLMGDGYFLNNNFPQIIAYIIVSLVLWFLGKALNRPTKKELGDMDPDFPIKKRAKHSLFFIPYQFYGPISLLYGSFYMIVF